MTNFKWMPCTAIATALAAASASQAGDNLIGGRLEIWGSRYGCPFIDPVPEGRFVRAFAAGNAGIAQRADGTLQCWGQMWDKPFVAPDGVFADFTVGDRAVGIRTDRTLTVWGFGDAASGRGVVPAGTFTKLATGGGHFAALGTSGAIACWGYNAFGQCNAPTEPFVDVSATVNVTVGLRSDGTVAGWGQFSGDSNFPGYPVSRFAQVSPGAQGRIAGWGCDGRWNVWVVTANVYCDCWNGNGPSEAPPPATQPLSAIGLTGRGAIALDLMGSIVRWGNCPTGQMFELSNRRFQSISTAFNYAVGVRVPCPGDLDCNDDVDSGDLAVALLNFGDCDACDADLDQGGEVDAGDVALMLLDFGRCP